MAEKHLPEAGLGAGTTVTATLVGVLSSCSGLVGEIYRDSYIQLVPYISPFLSWSLVWCYNRFVEPPEMASIKGRLKRDLKYLKKCCKDKRMSLKARKDAQNDYDETQLKLARLGRDFSAGLYSKPSTQ
ncbi:hypothetical protein CE143_17615 [Photorhabdus luminescens]|uniref:Uncharacterized protein n=1 Tax=Photorhabdus akhurstii TaxID=171438 RepID=A0ABX8LW79_9GAMM|nr:hypothetical protein [Photorhabdus akhurstii]QXF34782.1 hypothetical protein B0X70_17605 [Photorhabdus akhurstii]UJD76609.1 hypothetical protein CE143_17615 [Photorhabdus luminescens]